jgi:8-oxo-dGTP diphosphatase
MKILKVVAAIIERDGKILIARRNYGEFKGYFEFPGGKYENDESGPQAIKREIRVEFDALIEVKDLVCTVEHQYDSFYLVMDCFRCALLEDKLILHDHSEIRWIDADEKDIKWCPADQKVIEEYRKSIR